MKYENSLNVREACLELAYVEPINIESTGQVWLGDDPLSPNYLTKEQQAAVDVKAAQIYKAYLDAHPVPEA
jgi:hypothetical protein